MPTLSTGTGSQSVDIFYEVREGGASTSDRYTCLHSELSGKAVPAITCLVVCFRNDTDRPCLLMIMGEHLPQHTAVCCDIA